ncbi:uncharacterized protein M421DRAFT_266790 [Didymella exigua CBS 183.55]|uniref:Zn(2)-C6 fungal-type domain-containing protein n=1 Tax=Didymella exigua CBS 183.55 TaxID=1150837 RepID=A0A6A5RC76_9PLEO|nr:uncharacterized protein M421DRAFT_266790 [Didymella exigua CBS 183.55]KAF1924989.1 hypothetical protein M421DRAFT_266790 [Didymella exigua CBS 183.55]
MMDQRRVTPSGTSHRPPKPLRILACVLCQQRKVKCDRKFPCNHCLKAKVQCVPAQQMPRRRKRPTEQELTQRLRQYEELLRKNNIAINNADGMDTEDLTAESWVEPESSTSQKHLDSVANVDAQSEDQSTGEIKNFWDAMHQRAPNSLDVTGKANVDNNFGQATFDDLSEPVIVKVWGRVYESDHNHLFGDTKITVALSTLHPSHIHIFKLWQIYSENVNPLIKVTHGPTLQARILDAAADPTGISNELEALMFSIYCAALITLAEGECRDTFGEAKAKLLGRYQDACRQALINCGFLRSRDRDCLTAYFLYLISLRPDTNPHTLFPMFAIAFRIASRMNICNEAANTKHGIFEAEMRRRLWWAMVVYDSRISEMTDYKTTQLIPLWDCKIPLNVNDFDLRPEMTATPADQDALTEALFAVVRGAIGNFIRHNAWHLDFINPMLRHIAKATQHRFDPNDDNMNGLEHIIENQYLRHCNPENPLHYITIWWARNYLAKYRFFLHCSQHSKSPDSQPTEQRDKIMSYALRMLECDTALNTSPLTRGYSWLIQFHFPFPAYVRVVQDLRSRPAGPQADKAWEIMNANYAVRFIDMEASTNLLFKMFASTVLQAWAARHAALFGQDHAEGTRMIIDIKRKLGQLSSLNANADGTIAPAYAGVAMLPRSDAQQLALSSQSLSGQERVNYFDPSLAELNSDLLEMEWGNVDWSAMSGMGSLEWPN